MRDLAFDPDEVARRVLSCPSVASLSGGPTGGAATYLVGRRVLGVRETDTGVAVHVVVHLGPTAREVASEVRAALAGAVPGRVDVVLEDVVDPAEPVPVTGQAALAVSPMAVQEPDGP